MIHTKKYGKQPYHIQFGSGFQVCLGILYAVWDGGVSLVDRYLMHMCIIQGPGKGDRDFVCQEGVNRIYVFLVALVSHSSIFVVS